MKNIISDETRTRELVARAILERGPATAVDLAQQLQITPAGVRRHLDGLVEEGVLEAREPHARSIAGRTRGRPAKVFIMTDRGRQLFEHSYDDLAVMAIKFMASDSGDEMINRFAQFRAEDLERRASASTSEGRLKKYRKDVSARKVVGQSKQSSQVDALAKFLTKDGYAATVHIQNLGQELCQHHCPIAHVASEFPQLCEAETIAISNILGSHVQRLATIADGDGVCTTFIPEFDLVKKNQANRQAIRKAVKR